MTRMLDILGDYLNLRKIVFSRLDGSMNYIDRQVDVKLICILNRLCHEIEWADLVLNKGSGRFLNFLVAPILCKKIFLAIKAKITPIACASNFPTITYQMWSIHNYLMIKVNWLTAESDVLLILAAYRIVPCSNMLAIRKQGLLS
jgi:hypothetical protein